MSNILQGLLKDAIVNKISQSLGQDSGKTKSAMEGLLPAILGGLAKKSAKKEEADLLSKVLEKDHDGSILDNLDGFLGDIKSGKGDKILGHVLGSKSDLLAQMVGEKTGLGKEQTGKLMETLAPLVMGAVGKEAKEKGALGSNLGDLLQGAVKKFAGNEELKKLAFSFLDKDGDGDIKDDLLDMGKKYLKKFMS